MNVYAVLDSPDILSGINSSPVPESGITVAFEAFDATTGELADRVTTTAGAGLANDSLQLEDGNYKIRAIAEGFQESWYTVPSGLDGGAFEELLRYQQRHTLESADRIVVDSSNPGNSSWNSAGWTVLHRSVSSISGAVTSTASAETGSQLGDVLVELFDEDAPDPDAGPIRETSTDEYGYYTFADQAPGSYTIRFTHGTSERWWPETAQRAEAEAITLDGANHFNLAYAVFPPSDIVPDPDRVLTLTGEPALGATITAAPDFVDESTFGVDCLQRYTWFLDGNSVDGAFGSTFVVPLEAGGGPVSARLDIVGMGCPYTALASNPVGPVDLSLTIEGTNVEVSPVDSSGGTAVALTFGNVTTAGSTTVTRLDSGDAFPAGSFSSLTEPPLYYDIETTAVFDHDPVAETGVTVCITFDTTGMTAAQAAGQHLYHFVDGAWADITDSTLSGNGKVCGVTYSFSPFAVGQPHWPFQGFLHPVDNGATLNAMKAGGAVPIKFGLGGNRGLDILAAGAPSSSAVACPGGTVPDDIEQTVAAGTSSLSYSASSETYTFVWKTQKAWAGSCRQFDLGLGDGTVHTAMFDFRK